MLKQDENNNLDNKIVISVGQFYLLGYLSNFIIVVHPAGKIDYLPLGSDYEGQICVKEPTNLQAGIPRFYICPQTFYGQYIIVQQFTNSYLSICEIEIHEGK